MTSSARDGVVVREARAADSARLALLLSQLGHEEMDTDWLEGWLRHLDRASDRVLVAELSGEPVGVAVIHLTPFVHLGGHAARVTALVVDQSVRSRGVGALLLDACEAAARDMGSSALELTTRETRRGAHRFYERQGYSHTARKYVKTLG